MATYDIMHVKKKLIKIEEIIESHVTFCKMRETEGSNDVLENYSTRVQEIEER